MVSKAPPSAASSVNSTSRPLFKSICFGLSDSELFLIFCMLGAAAQIIHILERFFAYEYLIRAQVGVPEDTTVPDTNICFAVIDVINYTSLFATYPSFLNELGYPANSRITPGWVSSLRSRMSEDRLTLFFFERLKINQLWDQMIQSSEIFYKAWTVIITEDTIVERPCRVANFFSERAYCYTFNCTSPSGTPYVSSMVHLYKKLTHQEILTISIHQPFFDMVNYYWIALTPSGTYPRGQLVKWESQEAFNLPRRHTFFFYSIEVNLLPAPYASNCVDYTTKGFTTAAEMEDRCQIKLGIERTQSPLTANLIDAPLDAYFGPACFAKNLNNQTFMSIISDIVEYCDHLTIQPDCNKIIYIPSARTPLPITGDHTEVTVEQITDPVYKITAGPKMTLLDFIIAIGSVLGTWLGFSIAYSIPQVAGIAKAKIITKLKIIRPSPGKLNDRSDPFSLPHLDPKQIYGISLPHRSGRFYHHTPPPYHAYHPRYFRDWPLIYDARAKPWWFR